MPTSLDPQKEQALVEQGYQDMTSFQELYLAYFPRVFAYASYRVGSEEDAEDVVSHVFLKALEDLKEFHWQGEGSFAAWLFSIAHHTVIDAYRSGQKEQNTARLEELPDLASFSLLPLDELQQKEKLAYLRQLIAALPPRHQEIITLKYFGGLQNKAIAEVLGLDERTVASHLCRGLSSLHRRYLDMAFQQEGEVSHE